jgi:predicted RNA methylase
MKLKHLEAALSSCQREFPDPKVSLEQYPTSAHLAASVALLASEHGDIGSGMSVLDLGCGTGMLSMAASFLCDYVVAVDCDNDAIEIARKNSQIIDMEDTIFFIQAKVNLKKGKSKDTDRNSRKGISGKRGHGRRRGGRGSQSSQDTQSILIMDKGDGIPLKSKCVDTVIANPPFGTKSNAGIDAQFLRTATRLARHSVYSFHKRSTRHFLTRLVESWGHEIQVAAEMEFDVPQMYQFHKQKQKDIEVDLLRVIIRSNQEAGASVSNKEENSGGSPV